MCHFQQHHGSNSNKYPGRNRFRLSLGFLPPPLSTLDSAPFEWHASCFLLDGNDKCNLLLLTVQLMDFWGSVTGTEIGHQWSLERHTKQGLSPCVVTVTLEAAILPRSRVCALRFWRLGRVLYQREAHYMVGEVILGARTLFLILFY